jgi:asparagine synthase (glutamine-hydrolysing)
MCGIAGFISFGKPFGGVNEDQFHSPLRFRGPDHFGTSTIQTPILNGKLFHYRLSIIDLDPRSNQPMRSNSGNAEIVFNGEIYNYREIKNELEREGYVFRTQSDTEVILCAYEFFGIDILLNKLDGMFALVIIDYRADKILLARDPFGKKPLYYFHDPGGKIAFSSDLRSFDALGISLSPDPLALSYFFCELSTPETQSIYKEVKKVPPGTYITLSTGPASTRRYWNVDYSQKTRLTRAELIDESERLLENAVKKRLVSDVGVGAFLSGGIDSSLVVAMMAKNSSKPVRTYTVGFSNAQFDESSYAKKVAEKWNTDHHELRLDEMDPQMVSRVLEECGEPFADASVFPSWLVCNAISKTEKVALSGDGGDEIFGGYYEYYFASRLDKYRSKKGALKALQLLWKAGLKTQRTKFAHDLFTQGYDIEGPALLHRTTMGFHPAEVKKLVDPALFSDPMNEFKRVWEENIGRAETLLDRVMSCSLHTRLVNDYLVKIDRASMMNSLEVRSPFLDQELVQFAARIPNDQLIYNGIPKSITKEIAKKYLPAEDIHRPKMGFGVPVGEWFRGALKFQIENIAERPSEKLNQPFVKKIITGHLTGINHTDKLVTLFAFHQWLAQRNA